MASAVVNTGASVAMPVAGTTMYLIMGCSCIWRFPAPRRAAVP
jgi:hypothetical protein